MSVSRKQIANAFKASKPKLSHGIGGTNYICFAIEDGNLDNDYCITPAARAAKAVIEKRLGHCMVVTEWLQENVPGFLQFNKTNDSRLLVQTYRHRWLDSLIEEFGG